MELTLFDAFYLEFEFSSLAWLIKDSSDSFRAERRFVPKCYVFAYSLDSLTASTTLALEELFDIFALVGYSSFCGNS